MQYDKIDKRRLPDIECEGGIYLYRDNAMPLEQVLAKGNGRSVFLVGNGGQGKSTTLFAYWLEHFGDSIYVDMKLLSSRQGEYAIQNIIKEEYFISIEILSRNTIILLDGINEAPLGLREKYKNQKPQLISEIDKLRAMGFCIVLAGRLDDVGLLGEEDEIDDGFNVNQFAVCTLHELREQQVKDVIPHLIYSEPLIHLLQNNAMLSMYCGLNSILGVDVFESDDKICAGVLLEKYFEIYIRLKYIKKFVSGEYGQYTYKDIYEELNLKRKRELIREADKSWNQFNSVLLKYAFSNRISENVLHQCGESALALGILRSTNECVKGKQEYCFADELYQTYFLMQYFKKLLCAKKNDSVVIAAAVSGFIYLPERVLNELEQFEYKAERTLNYVDLIELYVYIAEMLLARTFNAKARENLIKIMIASQLGFARYIWAKIVLPELNNDIISNDGNFNPYFQQVPQFVIPSCVKKIQDDAFQNWLCLEDVTIPKSVEYISPKAFVGCSLKRISVEDGNSQYHASNNCLIETNTKKLVVGNQDGSIPEDGSIYSIGEYAFSGREFLNEIVIPEGVVEICEGAFKGCVSMESIFLPTSLCYIGNEAFRWCKALQDISIPDNVEKIGEKAFHFCESLLSINLPDKITEIEKSVFERCLFLHEIVIPNQVQRIYEKAFEHCVRLKRLVLPQSLMKIETDAFNECFRLKEVYNPSTIDLDSDDNSKITDYACHIYGTEELAGHFIELENFVFYEYCDERVLVEYFGDDTKVCLPKLSDGKSYKISKGAFIYCDIEEITFSDEVTEIGDSAFESCDSLRKVILNNGLMAIGKNAFFDCTSLEKVFIPKSVALIGEGAFANCATLLELSVDLGNNRYCSLDNCIIDKQNKSIIAGCKNSTISKDNSLVRRIGNSAFYGCVELNNISIPSNIESIGEFAFFATGLLQIYFEDGLRIIETGAFQDCHKLYSMTLPNSLEIIGDKAFKSCLGIRILEIPMHVKRIGNYAFYDCACIETVKIPQSVMDMGCWVFYDCNALEEIVCEIESKPSGWSEDWIGKFAKQRLLKVSWNLK